MEQLEGGTAVVTGGASGIGLGIARAAGGEGMHVVIADIEEGPGREAAATIAATGARALFARTNVMGPDSVEALADLAFSEFGRVDLLCNNAGVHHPGLVSEMSRQDWRWLLGVNLEGVIHALLAFLPRMLEQGGESHIVNTSSLAGLLPLRGGAGYTTSKFAVTGLTEVLRGELAPHGIGVSLLCPGPVNTNIGDSTRNRRSALDEDGGETADPEAQADVTAVTAGGMDPDLVGRIVIAGVVANDRYIIPHPERRPDIEARMTRLLQGFDRAQEMLDSL
ncbi:MAG: SDR family NAD(P)-dependent oxidoreductase [Chloroflexi bacterium]|nr:SDR family NAD(P)-dependent oxidoreductase [Chloroflexota bacterium]